MALLLTQTFFDDFFLALYHSSISCIRQQSLSSIGFLSAVKTESVPVRVPGVSARVCARADGLAKAAAVSQAR